jgi:hypothetical protein
VPIYLGAPNVEDFLPHQDSIVDVRQYPTAEGLAEFLGPFLSDWNAYINRFHQWKAQEHLPSPFLQKLDECVHLAECRICKKVLQLLGPEQP